MVFRRDLNFYCFLADAILVPFAASFFDIGMVISYFFVGLGVSNMYLSIYTATGTLFFNVPQIYMSYRFEGLSRVKPTFFRYLILSRVVLLVYPAAAFYLAGVDNELLVVVVILTYAASNLLSALFIPGYYIMLSQSIDHGSRGKLYGTGALFSGALILLATYMINHFLKNYDFRIAYFLIFLCGSIILIGVSICFFPVGESERNVISKRPGFPGYLHESSAIIYRDKDFTAYLITSVFTYISYCASIYLIPFVTRELDASVQMLTIYITTGFVSFIAGSFAAGVLGDIFGKKNVATVAVFINAGSILFVIFSRNAFLMLIPIAVCSFTFKTFYQINLVLAVKYGEKAENGRVSLYTAAYNLIVNSAAVAVLLIFGIIGEAYSLKAVFAICLVSGIVSFYMFVRKVHISEEKNVPPFLNTKNGRI